MERVRSVESVQAPRPLRSLSKSTSAWHSRASTSKLPPATWNDLMCLSEGIHAEAVRMLEDGEAGETFAPPPSPTKTAFTSALTMLH